MKRKKLLETTPRAVPDIQSEDVVAASQIIQVDGEQSLCIDLFYMGELKGRYFADEETYNAWVDGKWYTCKLKNVARLCKSMETLKGDYYYFAEDMIWASDEDKKRTNEFLDTYSIDTYEVCINGQKQEIARQRKKERIAKEMDHVPCVPDEVMAWVEETIFPRQYLFIKKNGKRSAYRCTACGSSSWRKKAWKHGEITHCPKCGVQVKASSRQKEIFRKESVIILQAYGNEWVERQFKATCRWRQGEKKIRLLEQCRAIIPKGKCWGKVWYGTKDEADEFEQEYWDTNPLNKRFLESYLYPGNLREVLPYGDLQQSGLTELANCHMKVNVNKYITTFHARPWIEYLVKAGLIKLAADIVNIYGGWGNPPYINIDGSNLRSALRLDGNRIARMKQINGSLCILDWLQYEEKTGKKISQDSLKYLSEKKVKRSECQEILKEVGSINRMVNYMKKQRVAPSNLVHTWRDYLQMARNEGLNLEDDIVRLPKDLKTRHDQLVEIINARADEERRNEEAEKYRQINAQIIKRLPEIKKYFWENDTYMIIPAGKCEELVTEGRTLHHCVGSSDIYMKRMANGATWILFLRKKENLEKPYYTIEINLKDDRIIQYYSEFDRKPDIKIIKKVLDEFKRSIKRQRSKIQVADIA